MPSIPTTLPRLRTTLPDDVQLQTASVGAGSTGALAVGALAVGALAVGAFAVGAMAIGRLAIKRLAIRRASIGALSVGELEVGTLRVRELLVEQDDAAGPAPRAHRAAAAGRSKAGHLAGVRRDGRRPSARATR